MASEPVIRTLFLGPEGKAIKFYLCPCPLKTKLRPLIEDRGGILTSKPWDKEVLHLVEPDVKVSSFSEKHIRVDYVYDCIRQKTLLPIEKYLISERMQLDADSDLSMDGVEDYKVRTTVKNTRSRKEYSEEEDLWIINYIVRHHAVQDVKGNAMWKEMEIAMPHRTWQSLKERFRKHIRVYLDSYRLTPKEHKYLKKGCDLWTKKDELKFKEKTARALGNLLSPEPSRNSIQTRQKTRATSDIATQEDVNENSERVSNKSSLIKKLKETRSNEAEDANISAPISSRIRIKRIKGTLGSNLTFEPSQNSRKTSPTVTSDISTQEDEIKKIKRFLNNSSPVKEPEETRSDETEDNSNINASNSSRANISQQGIKTKKTKRGLASILASELSRYSRKTSQTATASSDIATQEDENENSERLSNNSSPLKKLEETISDESEDNSNISSLNSSRATICQQEIKTKTATNSLTSSPSKKTTSNTSQIPEGVLNVSKWKKQLGTKLTSPKKIQIYSDTDSEDTMPFSQAEKTPEKCRVLSPSSDASSIEIRPIICPKTSTDENASFETCVTDTTNGDAYDSFDENILNQVEKSKQHFYKRLQKPRHCDGTDSPKESENLEAEQTLTALPLLDSLHDSNSFFQESQAELRQNHVLSTPLSPKVSQILGALTKTYSARKPLKLSDSDPTSPTKSPRHSANNENRPLTERKRNISNIEVTSHHRIDISKGIEELKKHVQEWLQQESDVVVLPKSALERVQGILEALEEDYRRETLDAQVSHIKSKPSSSISSKDNDVLKTFLEKKFLG